MINEFAHLLHGTDEVLCRLADLSSPHCGCSAALKHSVGTVMAVHLHCVSSLGRPAQLVMHEEVDRKHVQALRTQSNGLKCAKQWKFFNTYFKDFP